MNFPASKLPENTPDTVRTEIVARSNSVRDLDFEVRGKKKRYKMMWWWVPCTITMPGNRIGTVHVALELELFGTGWTWSLGL